jgi:2-oxoglutarate ferredoxin oxidoreductase subunit beta
MNNGCYGLTKGQNSATADIGSFSKAGAENLFPAIDLVGLALELGATFVARSFSGDKTQLVPLIKAAISHSGFAFIDIVSPCVTFNNKPSSTKSYDYVREHLEATATIDFVPSREAITVDYGAGKSTQVELHDGSVIHLAKLAPQWDPRNRNSAVRRLMAAKENGEILTGLLYIDSDSREMHELEQTVRQPLNQLGEADLNPGAAALDTLMDDFR